MNVLRWNNKYGFNHNVLAQKYLNDGKNNLVRHFLLHIYDSYLVQEGRRR